MINYIDLFITINITINIRKFYLLTKFQYGYAFTSC
jgi:hypothetical protein